MLAIQGVRLVASKWYSIKVDWIEKSLATSANSLGISKSAQQQSSTENSIEVKWIAWLKRLKDRAQLQSTIVKVAIKAEAEKLLSDWPTFRGSLVTVYLYIKCRIPKVCYKF